MNDDIFNLSWDDAEWMTLAACKSVDPEAFIPARHRNGGNNRRNRHLPNYRNWDKAKATCATCPVITQCLEFSLHAEAPYGEPNTHWMFAAGLTPEELNERQDTFDRKRRRRSA